MFQRLPNRVWRSQLLFIDSGNIPLDKFNQPKRNHIMSIKLFTAAALIAASTATVATANSNFGVLTDLPSTNTLDLGNLRAASDGIVEIYDYRAGEQRALLGSADVHAGANRDVRVGVQVAPRFDVIALMKVDGQIVASQVIDINR